MARINALQKIHGEKQMAPSACIVSSNIFILLLCIRMYNRCFANIIWLTWSSNGENTEQQQQLLGSFLSHTFSFSLSVSLSMDSFECVSVRYRLQSSTFRHILNSIVYSPSESTRWYEKRYDVLVCFHRPVCLKMAFSGSIQCCASRIFFTLPSKMLHRIYWFGWMRRKKIFCTEYVWCEMGCGRIHPSCKCKVERPNGVWTECSMHIA